MIYEITYVNKVYLVHYHSFNYKRFLITKLHVNFVLRDSIAMSTFFLEIDIAMSTLFLEIDIEVFLLH